MGLKYCPVRLDLLTIIPLRYRRRCVMFPLLILFASCAHVTEQPPPTLAGAYAGTAAGGEPLSLQLQQDENKISGFGTLGTESFTISALGSWHAPAVIFFESGRRVEGRLVLASDGNMLDFTVPGETISAGKTTDSSLASEGKFAGSYYASGLVPVRLTVLQQDSLISGSGFAEGKPIAVVARQTDSTTAKGAVLFQDESRASVTIIMEESGRKLTIRGLGAPLEMRRR